MIERCQYVTDLNGSIIYVSDSVPGDCVYNSSCLEIKQHLAVPVCMCVCVNICMSMWVTHHYPAPWASFSDAHLSAPLLHTEPSEPSVVYTLPLLLLAPSLFISLTHSHAHLFSLRLSLTFSLCLPPAPYSTSPFLTHSCSLVFLVFSLATLPPSLFITVPLCIYLCRSRLIQTQSLTHKVQSDTQGLSVLGLSLLVYRCVARERGRRIEKRWQREEWNETCKWKEKDVGAFQTFKLYTWEPTPSPHCCPPPHLFAIATITVLPNANTLIPSGCRNSCCVVSPLLPTPSPFCQLQLCPTADC